MALQVLYQGRRVTVVAADNDTLAQVCARAVAQLGASSPSSFVLKYGRSDVDHSTPLSSLNIPNNATLTLVPASVRSNKPVRIGLRVGGKRLQTSASSDVTLLGLLELFAADGKLDPAWRPDTATLQLMRRTFGPQELRDLTLNDIGVRSGSAMFTLGETDGAEVAGQDATQVAEKPDEKAASATAPRSKQTPSASRAAGQVAPKPETPRREVETVSDVVPAVEQEPMDLEQPVETEKLPAPSLETCSKALQLLRDSYFDAVSSSTISILLKLMRNILTEPQREDRRRLRRGNAKLREEIFTRKGGEEFLLGVGFQLQGDDLVLPMENPHEELLKPAYALLAAEAQELNLEVPPLTQRQSRPPPVPFDPFKSLSTSLVPRPRRAGDPARSVTSTRLAELEARREAIVLDKPEDRELVVIAPAEITEMQIAEGQDDGREEDVVVLSALRRQLAKSHRAENAPLKTRALREVEKLSQKVVYAHTLLRIVFADKYIVQAKFSPRETVADVLELLGGMVVGLAAEDSLILSDPPRRGLPLTETLEELRLVPAARLVVGTKSGNTVQLTEDVRSQASSNRSTSLSAYPAGVRLSGSTPPDPVESARAEESKQGGTRKVTGGKKPKWMKIG